MKLGGFPEPLFGGNQGKAERWSRLRLDRLAYEDTRDVKVISDLNAFRTLLDLVLERIGSRFSFNSLREDVGVAYATVRDWVLLSEMLYYGFFIRPYSKNIKRGLTAEPKFYLFDILQIPATENAKRIENLAAFHLLKARHYWTDAAFGFFELHFVKDKEKREVDFLSAETKSLGYCSRVNREVKQLQRTLLSFLNFLKHRTTINFALMNLMTEFRRH